MKKNVWILNHYAGNMLFDKGGRHYCFAKYLQRKGYKPTIFVCNIKHNPGTERYINTDALWVETNAEDINTPFVFIKAKEYRDNGKERLLNMLSFYRNLQKVAKQYAKKEKPDVVIASSAHPLTLVAGIKLARLFQVKCICEVRDLWPESIVAYKQLSKKNLLIRMLYQGEKWIYKKADQLIFTMEGAYDYIIHQGWGKLIPNEKVHLINNGVDLEQYFENRERYQIDDNDLTNPDLFKVIYTGSIRSANNIRLLLDAAKEISDERIKILVWGDGDELAMLKKEQTLEGINNIVFKGKAKKNEIPFILCRSDALFLDAFDENIAKYGISSNKLFEYLAAGKPILMNHIPNYNPAGKRDCTLTYNCTANSLAQTIKELATIDRNRYDNLCINARKTAENYSFEELTQKLINVISVAQMKSRKKTGD